MDIACKKAIARHERKLGKFYRAPYLRIGPIERCKRLGTNDAKWNYHTTLVEAQVRQFGAYLHMQKAQEGIIRTATYTRDLLAEHIQELATTISKNPLAAQHGAIAAYIKGTSK